MGVAALSGHVEGHISDALDKRERTIINLTISKLVKGTLDPQFAVQQWVALAETRRLKQTLLHRGQMEAEEIPEEL